MIRSAGVDNLVWLFGFKGFKGELIYWRTCNSPEIFFKKLDAPLTRASVSEMQHMGAYVGIQGALHSSADVCRGTMHFVYFTLSFHCLGLKHVTEKMCTLVLIRSTEQ
jgi:hypothetical protein